MKFSSRVLHIGVLTSNTRQVPTLYQCLHSVFSFKMFPAHVTVLCDSHQHPASAWTHLLNRCLRTMIHPTSTLLMLEDDVLIHADKMRDFFDEETANLSILDDNNFGALSLYCPRHCSAQLESLMQSKPLPPGVYSFPNPEAARGSQALLFSYESASWIDRYMNTYTHRFIDACIFDALKKGRRRLYYHLPSLVSHELGRENSATFHEKSDTWERSLDTDY